MGKKHFRLTIISCSILLALSVAGYLSLRHAKTPSSPLPSGEKSAETLVKGQEKAAKPEQQATQAPVPTGAGDEASSVLNDPDVTVRVQAVMKLRKQFSRETVDLLARFLNDKESVVVSEAIDTLGFIALNSEFTDLIYDLLEEKARDKSFASRGEALITAAMLGNDSRILPVISEYAAEKDEYGEIFAARALSFVSDPAAVPILKSLVTKTGDPEIMRIASDNLMRLDPTEAVSLLSEPALSSDADKQAIIARAIAQRNIYEYNDALVDGMASGNFGKKTISAIAQSRSAADVFGEVLQRGDIDKEDKIAWLGILGESGLSAPGRSRADIVDAITPLLDSGDQDIEVATLKTMGNLGGDEATGAEAVSEKFDSESVFVRGEALKAFIPYCTPRTYKPLLDLYWDKDQQIRRTAFFLSEQFLNESDREVLEKATTSEDELISKHAKIMMKNIFR